jgi:hypothetical protein
MDVPIGVTPSAPFRDREPILDAALEYLKKAQTAARPGLQIRVAAFLVVDYAKCLLFIGCREVGLEPNESWSISKRVDRLTQEIPEVEQFDEFFEIIEGLRKVTAHHDHEPPESAEVLRAAYRARGFRRFLDATLAGRKSGNSPSETVESLMNRCDEAIAELERLATSTMAGSNAPNFRRRQKDFRHLLLSASPSFAPGLEALQRILEIELQDITNSGEEAEAEIEEYQRLDRL